MLADLKTQQKIRGPVKTDISTKWDRNMEGEADRFQKCKKASIEGRVLKGEIRRRESMWCRNSRGWRSVNSNSKAPTTPASLPSLQGLDTLCTLVP